MNALEKYVMKIKLAAALKEKTAGLSATIKAKLPSGMFSHIRSGWTMPKPKDLANLTLAEKKKVVAYAAGRRAARLNAAAGSGVLTRKPSGMDTVVRRNLKEKAENVRLGRRVKSQPATESVIESYLRPKSILSGRRAG